MYLLQELDDSQKKNLILIELKDIGVYRYAKSVFLSKDN